MASLLGAIMRGPLKWVILVIAYVVGKHYYDPISNGPMHISTKEDAPLYIHQKDFFPEDQLQGISSAILHHPWIGTTNEGLNPGNFRGTQGFVVKFNREGSQKLQEYEELSPFIPYYSKASKEKSNAFVLNVLVVNPTSAEKDAVKMHLDDTVGFNFTRGKQQFLAEEVNALYVQVPPDIEGGSLKLWRWHRSLLNSLKIFMWRWFGAAQPDALLEPQKNVMVTFRGDALHAVQGFTVPDNIRVGGDDYKTTQFKTKRVSLILEQYSIPEEFYEDTVTFEIHK